MTIAKKQHRIRLRGPWRLEEKTGDVSKETSIIVPCLIDRPTENQKFSRTFQWTTDLRQNEFLFVEFQLEIRAARLFGLDLRPETVNGVQRVEIGRFVKATNQLCLYPAPGPSLVFGGATLVVQAFDEPISRLEAPA